jgi:hypothetical protein
VHSKLLEPIVVVLGSELEYTFRLGHGVENAGNAGKRAADHVERVLSETDRRHQARTVSEQTATS